MQVFLTYCARRLVLTIPVLLGVVTIAFAVTRLAPGDPLVGFLPENPSAEQHAALAREFGLDRPLHVQWLRYVRNVASGNLGRSLRTGNPVLSDLRPALAATLELTLAAFLLAVAIGIPIGVYSAVKEGGGVDTLLAVISLGGVAAPLFWTALMAQVLFYGTLRWLPLGGRLDDFLALSATIDPHTGFLTIDAVLDGSWQVFRSALVHMLLPAVVLAYRASALVARLTRSAMVEVLGNQYMVTGRSLGLPERRVILRWAFLNTLVPVLTALGLTFGQLLQGSILVESVFNWPGLGLYTVQSLLRLDYPGVIAASMTITVGYVLSNAVVDVLYPVVDPRVRLQ
ncbi:MAG: ABC transporter permease [Armatimonadota bacterium]